MSAPTVRVEWPDDAPPLNLPTAGPARSLAERLARAGHPLNTRCGQRNLCGGCTVELREGRFRLRDGREIDAPAEIKACQGDVASGSPAVINVPARSVAVHRPQIVTTFEALVPAAHQPIVAVVPGKTDHGLAIDIGTTTVVVALVDLVTGDIVAEESALNRQVEMGDDVLTRIQLAGAGKLVALREAIVSRTLRPLIEQVSARREIDIGRLGAAVVAGNTTMLHLLTGTDPTSMGVAPFRAPFTDHRVWTAGALGLGAGCDEMPVHLLPGFSAYVGADLVAGCLCTGLLNDAGPALLVDIGTNGEILLRQGERLLATATAAGPAFEGGRLARGTRAIAGAVAHIAFANDCFPPELEFVPGSRTTAGLCGSAYVDFLAEGRRLGLLGHSGRLTPAGWDVLPAEHRVETPDGRGVRLRAGDVATEVTEVDIAHLLQAKAAISAGIMCLLRRAGVAAADVRHVYLAGGFGLHLDVPKAIACGLLPGFVPDQVRVVGNTSLGGAWLALVDRTILPEMALASTSAEVVELNLEPDFEDTFIDQLLLP